MICLGFESSCDETSVAIIRGNEVLAIKTHSQIDLHAIYGGVVPELAARSHISYIKALTQSCLKSANLTLNDIDIIAVTSNPGLIGGLLIGVVYAKTLSLLLQKPLIAVDHLEGHIFTTGLTDNIYNNFFMLLVSGGHTKMMVVKNYGDYQVIGQTIDDSLGECFDKVAKTIGLDYPGGPKIEALANGGYDDLFDFKTPLQAKGDKYNFSFSGLKTFMLHQCQNTTYNSSDIAASFQKITGNILCNRVKNMFIDFKNKNINKFVMCGGVSANKYLRNRIINLCDNHNITPFFAPLSLCGDNAAMIANIGILKYNKGIIADGYLTPQNKSIIS